MREIIHKCYCDRCGKELEKEPLFYIDKHNMAVQKLTEQWHYTDLCDDCKNSFMDWWNMKEK